MTNYVVVGENAGASKLAAIKKLSVSTLDEDGFLALIGSRKGKLDAKAKEKLAKEEEKIKKEAAAMTKLEKAQESQTDGKAGVARCVSSALKIDRLLPSRSALL